MVTTMSDPRVPLEETPGMYEKVLAARCATDRR